MIKTIINKSKSLSVDELRIMYILFSKILQNKTSANKVIISSDELKEKLGIDNSHMYTDISECFNGLMKKLLINVKQGKCSDNYFIITNIERINGNYHITFNRKCLKEIEYISKKYYKINYEDMISFCSKHSISLYKIIIRVSQFANGFRLTTDELKNMMNIEEQSYCRKNGKFDRHSFELNVIRKSVDEINEKSNCINNLEYSKEYDGRKVKCYSFSFEYVDPNSIGKENNYINNDENKTDKNFSDEVKNYVWW